MKKLLFSISLIILSFLGHSQCLTLDNLSVNPLPTAGVYPANTTVNFCYTITSWQMTGSNWLHGVIPSFGPGWNVGSITTTPSASVSSSGTWSWTNSWTSSSTGNTFGPGFAYDYTSSPGNPGNNFGDMGNGPWTFCWSITTASNCINGTSLSISINTTGDGESGSWGSTSSCQGDGSYVWTADVACCTVVATGTNVTCFNGNDGSAVATPGISGTPPFSYSWSNGQSTQSINNLVAGTYIITCTDATNCISLDTIIITQPPVINTSFISTNVSCNSGSDGSATVNPSNGVPPYTFSWSNSQVTQTATGLSVGTYTVTVIDANGCLITNTINITEPTQLLATIAQHTDVSCNGLSDGLLGVSPSGGTSPYSFMWSNGQNTPIITSLPIGIYNVTVTDDNGCIITLNNTIIQPPPLIATYTTTTLDGCVPHTVTYTNNTLNSASCVWTFNGNPISSCLVTYTYNIPGVYNVILTVADANGCVSISPTIVSNVYSNPISSFGTNPTYTNISNPNINFTNSSSPGTCVWDFGDGLTSTDQSPEHTYSSSGTYTIQLIVTSPNGCVDTSYQKVYIDNEFTIYFPNTFSPNGDGKNDIFFPVFSGVVNLTLYIYDRWGLELYKTSDTPWDGIYHGSYVQEDVYTWKVEITDNSNKQHDYIGRVTVVR